MVLYRDEDISVVQRWKKLNEHNLALNNQSDTLPIQLTGSHSTMYVISCIPESGTIPFLYITIV